MEKAACYWRGVGDVGTGLEIAECSAVQSQRGLMKAAMLEKV